MILGIDLCEKYAQVSVFNKKENSVDTPLLFSCENSCNVPMNIAKKIGSDEWFIGDECERLSIVCEGIVVENILSHIGDDEALYVDGLSVSAYELLQRYIKLLLDMVTQGKPVESISVCVEDFRLELLDTLKSIFEELKFDMEKVDFINRKESIMYYILSQKREIWYGDVVVFDYGEGGLYASVLSTKKNASGQDVIIEDVDYSDRLPFIEVTTEVQRSNVDEVLMSIAAELFEKKVVSSVFLTGQGFDTDASFDGFIRLICNRRRVFAGQNMYSKGACYCSIELLEPQQFVNRTLISSDRLMFDMDVDIVDREKPGRLRIVRPGTNWYKARKKYDFFVDGVREIVIHKKMYKESTEKHYTISLEEFPVRPDKAMKIGIGFDFDCEGKCIVSVKDRGFGDFFKSSEKIIYKEI